MLSFLLFSLRASAFEIEDKFEASVVPLVNEKCPDLDKAVLCENACTKDLRDCSLDCGGGAACQTNCNRKMIDCIDSCPCHTECFDGCINCENSVCTCADLDLNFDYQDCMSDGESQLGSCIVSCAGNTTCYIQCDHDFKDTIKECPCNENCATGCPCEGYVCSDDEISTTAVLVLSTHYEPSDPILVDFRGRVDREMVFTLEADTSVTGSCSVKFQGKFYVFGGVGTGRDGTRQISRIQGCSLIRQDEDLPFDFKHGACNSFTLADEVAFLCFSESTADNAYKTCHTWNGKTFTELPGKTKFNHRHTRLLNYRNSPLAVGDSTGNKVEILEFGIWDELEVYPYHNYISKYAAISKGNAVIVFGGYDGHKDVDNVAKFQDKRWFDMGKLRLRRHGHSAISFLGHTVIVGGFDLRQTEYWNEESLVNFASSYQEPALYRFYDYPEMFLVPRGFCKDGLAPEY